MDPDGGGIVRLTDDPAEDTDPTWSPDGTRIAFVSTRDGNKEIYVVSASGGGATRLTNNAFEDITPVWSPSLDNQRIAFVSNRDGNDEVYVMGADGSGQTNVTRNEATITTRRGRLRARCSLSPLTAMATSSISIAATWTAAGCFN
jgi:TolB protein